MLNHIRRSKSHAEGKENGEAPMATKQQIQKKISQQQPIAANPNPSAAAKKPLGMHQPQALVEQSGESEHVCLQEWSFAFNGSRPLQLTGRVYNNALRTEEGFDDGDLLEYTSQVVNCNGRVATTMSGTVYTLGKPASGFDQLRKQLWISSRSGQRGRDDGSSVPPLDEDNPLLGVKLGEVVAAAPVRLPKVAGWSHQSGVAVSPWAQRPFFRPKPMALPLPCRSESSESLSQHRWAPCVSLVCWQLLNDWSPFKTEAGFIALTGTVYNCPGAYDGETTHRTSTVVDCAARVLRTMEGAEYYLGFPQGQHEGLEASVLSNEEAKALGLLEEDGILAV